MSTSKFLGYRCSICGEEYGPDVVTYTCPNDGGNLDVVLDVRTIWDSWTTERLAESSENSIWRYLPLLPVDDPGFIATPLRAVGWTPIYRPTELRDTLGLPDLWIKDDGRNPTASFKDRASAVVVARSVQIEAGTVVTASTGNAGAALAGMAAAAGVPAVILAPKTAPQAKVAQLLMFGAQVFLVDGTYDEAFDLTVEAAEEFGWYCRNTGYNPFTAEGKKTASLELCEQLTIFNQGSRIPRLQWLTPDVLFVSVGDGNIISGLHKGFKDLQQLGWIERTPRLIGVQSTGSAAIANAFFAETEDIQPVRADTLADSISVDLPRDGLRALRAATETEGAYITVSDEDILAAMGDLARVGIFAEPAGAAAYAGLVAAVGQGKIVGDERIVVMNTGNGLKDIQSAMKAVGSPPIIDPTLGELRKAMKNSRGKGAR